MNPHPNVTLRTTLPMANGLGECVLWDHVRKHLLWTDMPGRRLYRYDPATDHTSSMQVKEDLCSFAFVAGSDELICAFESGWAFMDQHSGETRWLHRIDHAQPVRLNDGRVDRQGRFWVGSLVDNETNRPANGASGELLCLNARRDLSRHLDGIGISNSICWSPDGATMYFADTPLGEIYAFDFDARAGQLSNKRLFAQTPTSCGPDGSTVDADGYLWNAEWGMGRVVRYAPDGRVDAIVQLPVSNVTCLTFGGDDLSVLYVTTATYGLSPAQRAAQPQAGDVFVFDTPFRGLPEERFVSLR